MPRLFVAKWFRSRRTEVMLFLLLWLTYAYFYQSSQQNEAARFDQVRSLLEHRTLAIDAFAYNTADVIVYIKDGQRHVYPAKAPGTTFLATVPFGLVSLLLRPFDLPAAVHWHAVAYLTTILTVGLLSAFAAGVMYRVLLSMTADSMSSVLAVIAVWLGSISFPFSTLFFSHQLVAAQLVLAFAILFQLREPNVSMSRRRAGLVALAGFLVGFSVTCEYPSALLGLLLSAYFALRLWRVESLAPEKMRLVAAFACGIAAGLAPLVLYNLAAFGRLAYTPYQELAIGGGPEMFRAHSKGLVGISWPGLSQFLSVLMEITVKPQRGLLYLGLKDGSVFACSPVLWLAVPGLALLALRRSLRAEAALCAAMIIVYFSFNACYGDSIVFWGGGASVGPRHIIPVLPFVAIPLSFGLRRLKFLFYPLLLLSIFYMLLATAVEPRTPYRPVNPWSGLYLPAYFDGRFGLARDGLFDPGETLTANSTAFNLAKLAGVPGQWQLAPLMVLWFLLGSCLLNVSRDSGRNRSQALTLSTALIGVYTALIALAPPLLTPAASVTASEQIDRL
jgi:hypothetical protein